MALSILRGMQRYQPLKHGQHIIKLLDVAAITKRFVNIQIQKAPDFDDDEDYFDKNQKLKRPLSPIRMYKPQQNSVLSIMHRITGTLASVYVYTMGMSALILPNDFAYYITMLYGLEMGPVCVGFMKTMLAFPFVFHTFTGCRHLFWDFTTKLLENKEILATGHVVIALTIAATAFCTYYVSY